MKITIETPSLTRSSFRLTWWDPSAKTEDFESVEDVLLRVSALCEQADDRLEQVLSKHVDDRVSQLADLTERRKQIAARRS